MKMSATLVPKSLQTKAQFDTQIPARDQRAPLLSNNTTVISERDVDLSQSIDYNDLVAAIGDPNRILEYSPLKLMASALTDLRTQKKEKNKKQVFKKLLKK